MDEVSFLNEIPPTEKGGSIIVMTNDIINDGDTLMIPAKYFDAKTPKAYMYWKDYSEDLQKGSHLLMPIEDVTLIHPIPAYTRIIKLPEPYDK